MADAVDQRSPCLWPAKRKFALTVFDDTDNATVENLLPVYDCLSKLGIVTTKSVWPLRTERRDSSWGQCLEDPDYFRFVKELQRKGFEIAFHGARSGGSRREIIIEALDAFKEKIGHDPRSYAQHSTNPENIYWGKNRCNLGLLKPFASRFSQRAEFFGDVPGSEYYWADICHARIKYVRNYGFRNLDIRKNDPYTPYHDPRRPLVRNWFSTSYGLTPTNAGSLFSRTRVRKWEEGGALVVIQVHFGQGFVRNGKVHPEFEKGFAALGESKGWFAPVSDILDHVEREREIHELSGLEAKLLELKWARDMGAKTVKTLLRGGIFPTKTRNADVSGADGFR